MSIIKENFNEIYNKKTPLNYIISLGNLSYREPDFVYDVLLNKVDEVIKAKGKCKVIDIACSYGFNGAIAKYKIPYGKECLRKPRKKSLPCEVIGIDISENALSYANQMGFIDDCVHQNLELETVTTNNADKFKGADLIIASGAFSYISKKTLANIYSVIDSEPSFIGWPICTCDISEIISFLKEKHEIVDICRNIYPMRIFSNEQEKQSYQQTSSENNFHFECGFHDKLCVYKIHAGRRDNL